VDLFGGVARSVRQGCEHRPEHLGVGTAGPYPRLPWPSHVRNALAHTLESNCPLNPFWRRLRWRAPDSGRLRHRGRVLFVRVRRTQLRGTPMPRPFDSSPSPKLSNTPPVQIPLLTAARTAQVHRQSHWVPVDAVNAGAGRLQSWSLVFVPLHSPRASVPGTCYQLSATR
jgi:hypothetical protein